VSSYVVVGIDNGGNKNNATVLTADGEFLVDRMIERPSLVKQGPEVAVNALAEAFDGVLALTATPRSAVRAVGLDTPGPASARGVISSRGSTNFAHPAWRGFDVRTALESRLEIPVVYSNDANAAAVYAHVQHFGAQTREHSSVAAIVGTGLGGGVVHGGRALSGAAGMAGELGHVHIPMAGLLDDGQPVPRCNCGFAGDAESVASLTAIENNLLPYWLTRFPGHELAAVQRSARRPSSFGTTPSAATSSRGASSSSRRWRSGGCSRSPPTSSTRRPSSSGAGVVEAAPALGDWFLATVREHTILREEQAQVASFALVPDLDMAGARGSAIAALDAVRAGAGGAAAPSAPLGLPVDHVT
jgi:predicted NBD/HSP70 family sugar kinase